MQRRLMLPRATQQLLEQIISMQRQHQEQQYQLEELAQAWELAREDHFEHQSLLLERLFNQNEIKNTKNH